MYITVTNVMDDKRIDFAYLIQGKKVAVISMFSDNIQYQKREPLNLLLITNEEKLLLKGEFMGRELSTFVGTKVITTPLDTNETLLKQTSWHASRRLFSAWTNLTTLITWKIEISAMCYLGIM